MGCCENPVEKEPVKSVVLEICLHCGKEASKVEQITVKHIIKGEHLNKIKDTQYYFCEAPNCEVVYFSNDTGQYFTKRDVRVRVGLKESENPIQICYCFDLTEQMVRDELLAKGDTTIPHVITTEIRSGNCACEVKNPSGRCCLGEVNKIVKRLQAHLRPAAQSVITGEQAHSCCAPDAEVDSTGENRTP